MPTYDSDFASRVRRASHDQKPDSKQKRYLNSLADTGAVELGYDAIVLMTATVFARYVHCGVIQRSLELNVVVAKAECAFDAE